MAFELGDYEGSPFAEEETMTYDKYCMQLNTLYINHY
jgi:hypothetical protein